MSDFHYSTPESVAAFKRIDRLARWLDSAYRIPFTKIRIGGDALMDMAPGIGLIVSQGLSAYIVYEAWKQGAPKAMIIRMLGRLGIDTLISATPGVGWIGDIFYRANLRNVAELHAHLRTKASGQTAPSGLQPIRPIWTTVQAA